jgi:hypothetical protein
MEIAVRTTPWGLISREKKEEIERRTCNMCDTEFPNEEMLNIIRLEDNEGPSINARACPTCIKRLQEKGVQDIALVKRATMVPTTQSKMTELPPQKPAPPAKKGGNRKW